MLTEMIMSTIPLTDEENEALYHRIRTGDTAAISEMIERNMPGVISRVGEFLRLYPRFSYLRDDLVSEGFMALTKTVNRFTVIEAEKHPSGRIVFEIDRALGSYSDTEVGSGMMSERSVRRHRKHQDIPGRLPFDVNSPPANLWTKSDGRVVKKKIVDTEDTACWDQLAHAARGPGKDVATTALDNIDNPSRLETNDAKQMIAHYNQGDNTAETILLDEIMACCQCEEDEMIVNLRIKGYTDAEIGEQLSLSQQTINFRRKTIYDRYKERMSE